MGLSLRRLLLAAIGLLAAASVFGGEITLYEHQDFGGRRITLRDALANFEGGYWLFCTDARFEGTCRTFGPGEYASLPWDITNKISSGRRVSGRYPYNHAPNWSDEVVIPRDPSGTQQQ